MDNSKELVGQLRSMARSSSEASEMLARAKSRRQGDGSRDDLYAWTTPEETREWEAADHIEALQAENECLKAENQSLRAERDALLEKPAHLAKLNARTS